MTVGGWTRVGLGLDLGWTWDGLGMDYKITQTPE